MLHTKSIRSTLLLCVKTDGLVKSVFVNNRLLCVITHDSRRCRWQDWKQGCGHALRRVRMVVLRWQGSLVAHCLSCWRQMESEKRNRCEIGLLWGWLHQYQRDEFHFKEGNLGRTSFSWSMVRSHSDFKKDFGWIVLSVMLSGCVMTSNLYILFGLTFKWLHFKLYNVEKIFFFKKSFENPVCSMHCISSFPANTLSEIKWSGLTLLQVWIHPELWLFLLRMNGSSEERLEPSTKTDPQQFSNTLHVSERSLIVQFNTFLLSFFFLCCLYSWIKQTVSTLVSLVLYMMVFDL